MEQVNLKCDRCGNEFTGFECSYSYGGFYKIVKGSSWEKFADPGEKIVCFDCMHHDPRFIAVHGENFQGD